MTEIYGSLLHKLTGWFSVNLCNGFGYLFLHRLCRIFLFFYSVLILKDILCFLTCYTWLENWFSFIILIWNWYISIYKTNETRYFAFSMNYWCMISDVFLYEYIVKCNVPWNVLSIQSELKEKDFASMIPLKFIKRQSTIGSYFLRIKTKCWTVTKLWYYLTLAIWF